MINILEHIFSKIHQRAISCHFKSQSMQKQSNFYIFSNLSMSTICASAADYLLTSCWRAVSYSALSLRMHSRLVPWVKHCEVCAMTTLSFNLAAGHCRQLFAGVARRRVLTRGYCSLLWFIWEACFVYDYLQIRVILFRCIYVKLFLQETQDLKRSLK